MAEIFLVRHGQASFGADDYDQLSDLGVRQCRMLGAKMRDSLKAPVFVSGSLNRHHQTMAAFYEGYGEEVIPRVEIDHLNEFDHEDVFHVAFPEYRDKNTLVKALAKHDQAKKAFHFLFEEAVKRWSSCDYDDDYKESWPTFQQRVKQGLVEVRAITSSTEYKKRPVVAFTSGGPISVIVQEVMRLDDSATFSLNENLANSGVSRILATDNKISISYINNYSHLEKEPNLISYR